MSEKKARQYTKKDYYDIFGSTYAELINGTIYNMSPTPLTTHQWILRILFRKIDEYIEENGRKCQIYSAPFYVELSDDTVVQPDISVICDSNKSTNEGCTGAPDWIVEVTSCNAVHDYVTKLVLYHKYGVKEYWIVEPNKKTVVAYILNDEFDVNFFKFTDSIPVGIFDNKLEINIDELLSKFNFKID